MQHADAGTTPDTFAPRLLTWFDRHGRHDLPWQHPRTAYRVWLSEIMLQQTQVAVVIRYFQRFVDALPDIPALAAADLDTVQALWSGLGYYSRARYLHRAAQICMQTHGGKLPNDVDSLMALPGIGRSTAGAILAQAHGQRIAILDGNVKRTLARFHGVHGWPGTTAVEKKLWTLAEEHLPHARLADYTQAVMDFGATLCTRAAPACVVCPLQDDCVARIEGIVERLPEPRPGKALPTRRCVMLLLFDADGRVLLQRRPERGVWAGLWSLPELPDAQTARDWLATQVTDAFDAGQRLTTVAHGFSHYLLDIDPILWRDVRARARIADNAALRWAARDELLAIGLPSPVRKLLSSPEVLQP
ncbi:A/G-specific adenine glycosylase [Chiayiivirga flava]|uniref:Adenine DNA glycosylase n=1 Tax=Chiayiivirga flava TaxID=659595 RepID=A0A7W8G103_9GAMM|nr:A/G-specific adenine glycosylase [Chiayiivirga flava]MBB5207170.1 A/G-specific adenine glycosylase [Chiayiivirga flava]